MKVTFTCEKCGHELLKYRCDPHDPMHCLDTDCDLSLVVTQVECPKCAKLSYGPLTEEMLAEALEEADVLDEYDAYIGMARFVLRLLNKVGEGFNGTRADLDDYWGNTRDWLLDLVRQP